MICPKCKEEMSGTARFCSNCGISFASFNTPTEYADGRDLSGTMPELDPLVGQVLDGKYELLVRLGEGGMGAVYRARRVHIGDEVAVKVLLRKFVADSGLVERFRREARAAAQLRHPNIVAIYDYGEARNADAPAYIVMELVEGESLRQLLRREERLAPARAIALMRDICAGVGAAHRRQIFHRDLKPDNVIVLPADADRERETMKVVDFGIAKLRDAAGAPALTQAGTVMGTPYYMSPEQCRGEELDARSDVYSLGAMLYEMVAGAPVFNAPSLMGVLARHITEPPPPLPPESDVPPALAAVVMRALEKEPSARPADASELGRELRAAEEATLRQREAEAQRQREEDERRRQAAQAAQATEADRQRREAEERQRRVAEAQRQQAAAAEQLRQEEAERLRRQAEEREQRKREAAEAEQRKRAAEEAARRQQIEREAVSISTAPAGVGGQPPAARPETTAHAASPLPAGGAQPARRRSVVPIVLVVLGVVVIGGVVAVLLMIRLVGRENNVSSGGVGSSPSVASCFLNNDDSSQATVNIRANCDTKSCDTDSSTILKEYPNNTAIRVNREVKVKAAKGFYWTQIVIVETGETAWVASTKIRCQ
jgi:serine/threonine-protein kinase